MIKILVNGALGRMGCEALKAVLAEPCAELVGAVDIAAKNQSAGSMLAAQGGITVNGDLTLALDGCKPDVVIDFTQPKTVMDNLRIVLSKGARAVVGTTGFSKEDLAELDALAQKHQTAVLVAPNFSIGAILMMRLAVEAAKYLPKAEIIELHHDNKLDAPSGTARLTAEMLVEARGGFVQQGHPDEEEKLKGSRGANIDGLRVHSVRLPGYVAHQEVLFGGFGETLTIRHDSISRECFMPGVMLGCREIVKYTGLLHGLDKIMN